MSSTVETPPVEQSQLKPAGRTWLAPTAGYYAAFTGLGLVAAIIGPTLPGLAEQTGVDLSAVGILFTARSFGYLIASMQGGRLYDSLPGHRLLGLVLLGMAVSAALVPFVPWLAVLTLVVFLVGVGEGMVDVGGNTLLLWLHRHNVGPFLNGLHFFFGLGAFLAPIFVAQAIKHSGGIGWAYWAVAILLLPIASWVFPLPNPGSAAHELSEKKAGGRIDYRLVALIVIFFILYVGAEVGFGGWIYSYGLATGIGAETTAAYLTSAFWGALTIGRLLSIPLATRLRPRLILLVDLLGCIASLALILALPGSRVALWAGTLGAGVSMASIFPTTLALAERRMTITGKITGWFLVGAGLGGMVLPWLMGEIFERFSPQVTMLSIFINIGIMLGVYALLIMASGDRSQQSR